MERVKCVTLRSVEKLVLLLEAAVSNFIFLLELTSGASLAHEGGLRDDCSSQGSQYHNLSDNSNWLRMTSYQTQYIKQLKFSAKNVLTL